MFGGLFQRLDSPRRHLILLVLLLCAAFALTGALAWRAHRTEGERVAAARKALFEVTGGVLGQWALFVESYAGSSLKSGMPRGAEALVADPNVTVAELVERATPELLCVACESGVHVESFVLVDLAAETAAHAGAAPDGALLRDVVARVRAGDTAPLRPRLRGAVHFGSSAGGPKAVYSYVAHDEHDLAVRIFALIIGDSTTRETLRLALASVRSEAVAAAFGTTLEALFAVRASVAGAPVLDDGTEPEHARSMNLAAAPVTGLTLTVGVRPGAERMLLLGHDARGHTVLLAVLTLVIALLFAAALLQVRREFELARLRAAFIASVTHELRTPLAQIRMFTEMLLLGRARSDVDRRRALTIVDQEARRLQHLVENVLLFAKTDAGRGTPVAPEPVRLADEVRLATESFLPLARARSAELRLEVQENVVVPVDRGALRQIMINMLDNALKYGPTGQRVTIGAALFDDVARVWVDDEGPGIPPAQRERVFESFYRLPQEATRIAGSGIGLAVVRQLARLHGGSAVALAAPGGGARVMVELPGARLGDASGEISAAS